MMIADSGWLTPEIFAMAARIGTAERQEVDMAMSRDFKTTIVERIERDPAFAKTLLDAATNLSPDDESDVAHLIADLLSQGLACG